MCQLLKNLTNSIWHAFHALQSDRPNIVTKSKLKVLTANIGTLMDLYGVEKGLEHYRSTPTLTFKQYLYYLQKELFSSITDSTPVEKCRLLEEGIEEICWLLCRKIFIERAHPVFEDHSVYQLFRIFCLLAEMESDSCYLVTMHSEEVAHVASHLVLSLGLSWDPVDFSLLSAAIGTFRFPTFLAVLESKYSGAGNVDTVALTEAIEDLYQIYIQDVIKKGYLMKKGFLLPTLKYFWFVLRPGKLSYYKDSQQKEASGVINLNSNCWADASVSASNGGKLDRRFILSTPEHRCVELVAEDLKGRLQWLAAFQIAMRYAGDKISYQRTLANQRKSLRSATKQQCEETQQELNHERQARVAAEIQTKKLEAITREEVAKVHELEDVKKKLENLLEEEKRALRDEEIVRGLQARVLREEWEKREQLERLQQEQQQLLETEKLKRLEFEQKQMENERQLKDAELRLKQLEIERKNLDTELNAAREKIQLSEEAQILLESRMVVTRPLIDINSRGERLRRTQSFIPTTRDRDSVCEKPEDKLTSHT